MKSVLLLLACALTVVTAGAAPARFITSLEAGQPRHLVIFGTSLSKGGAWVTQLKAALDARYPGLVTLTNGAKGGQNSEWGRANVDANVVAHRPDVVFIEFAINDAVTRFNLPVERVRANVDAILDRIQQALPECEIILQVMNPAVGKPVGDFSHRQNQDAYQQVYRDAAKARGLLLIDHSIAWNALLQAEGEAGFKRYVPDGVHPNAQGYAKFVVPTLLASIGFAAAPASFSSAPPSPAHSAVRETDVLVYGGTAGGAMAAIQTARMGRRVLLLEPSRHIGGLTTGGLGATDAGQRYTVGGLAREFYQRIYRYYEDPTRWPRESREGYFPKHPLTVTEPLKLQWFFEPHVASRILDKLLAEAGVEVIRQAPLDRVTGVRRDGSRIREITTLDGRRYAAAIFIDATYEGDLMAAAGARFAVGREANRQYGETLNGVRLSAPEQTAHVSPYRVAGDRTSGLLPRVRPLGPVKEGDADDGTQAYNFRLCLTDQPDNRVEITRPDTYDPLNYEVVLRHVLGRPGIVANAVFSLTPMPNRKTDTNNRVYFSTDYVGGSHPWAQASDDERADLWQAHKDYLQGLLWFLAHDPRVPEALRNETARWGLARDEFIESGHWPPALYVREARRLLGEYVMTEQDCTGQRTPPDGLTLGSYAMDSHVVDYVVDAEGRLRADGWFVKGPKPYPISYRATLPKRAEVSNLLVAGAVSASHVAFGSIRMEPVFMNLGQATAIAAVLSLERGCALHDLPYTALRARLEAAGQIFDAEGAKQTLEALRKKDAARKPKS